MSHFNTFLESLNSIRPTIQLTFEFSRTEMKVEAHPDLPTDIVESLPFLELEIMCKSNDDLVFRIYRKSCHAGNYLYAFSYQTLSQKTSVIRGLFLMAFRYCDPQHLQEELLGIQQNFLQRTYERDQEGKLASLASITICWEHHSVCRENRSLWQPSLSHTIPACTN